MDFRLILNPKNRLQADPEPWNGLQADPESQEWAPGWSCCGSAEALLEIRFLECCRKGQELLWELITRTKSQEIQPWAPPKHRFPGHGREGREFITMDLENADEEKPGQDRDTSLQATPN